MAGTSGDRHSAPLTSILRSVEVASLSPGFFGPFFRIWIHPRQVTRMLIDYAPNSHIFLLSGLAGVGMAVAGPLLVSPFNTDVLVAMIAMTTVVAVVLGVVRLQLETVLMTWVGRWCGGRGRYRDVRCATAWTYGPEIAADLMLLPMMLAASPALDIGWNWMADIGPYGAIFFLLWRLFIQIRASLTAHGLLAQSGALFQSRLTASWALTFASVMFYVGFVNFVTSPLLLSIFEFAAAAEGL